MREDLCIYDAAIKCRSASATLLHVRRIAKTCTYHSILLL